MVIVEKRHLGGKRTTCSHKKETALVHNIYPGKETGRMHIEEKMNEEPRTQWKQNYENETKKTPKKGNMASTNKIKTPGGYMFAPLVANQLWWASQHTSWLGKIIRVSSRCGNTSYNGAIENIGIYYISSEFTLACLVAPTGLLRTSLSFAPFIPTNNYTVVIKATDQPPAVDVALCFS